VSEGANDRYGAFKVSAHDDLVTALGLAVQDDGPPVFSAAVGPPRPPLPYGILDDRPARQNRIGDDRALEALVPPWLRGRGLIRW
jgi:hypothetical protein